MGLHRTFESLIANNSKIHLFFFSQTVSIYSFQQKYSYKIAFVRKSKTRGKLYLYTFFLQNFLWISYGKATPGFFEF